MTRFPQSQSFFVLCIATVSLVACGGTSPNGMLKRALQDALKSSAAASGPLNLSTTETSCMVNSVLKDKEAAATLKAAHDAGKTGQELLDAVDSSDPAFTKPIFLCLSTDNIARAFMGDASGGGSLDPDRMKCVTDVLKKVDKEVLADVLTSGDTQTTDPMSSDAQAAALKLMTDLGACSGVPSGS